MQKAMPPDGKPTGIGDLSTPSPLHSPASHSSQSQFSRPDFRDQSPPAEHHEGMQSKNLNQVPPIHIAGSVAAGTYYRFAAECIPPSPSAGALSGPLLT